MTRSAETLPALLASNRPSPATVFAERPDGSTVTYADVTARSAQIAHALRASGVERGDRVAVQAEKSVEFLLLYLACVRSGAVLLPMNTGYTDDEVGYLVADAEPALIVRCLLYTSPSPRDS